MRDKREYQSAKDAMVKNIIFIDGMATAKEAVDLMREKNIEALIVEKRNEHDAYGIVVVQDFIKGVIIQERTSEEVNVFEIMTKPVVSVPGKMDVRYVARLLVRTGLRMAPVEEDGKYIGMISLSSIILDNLSF
ncbi:MAG: CBS domain-containing protein [Eudoraea sp.]|jgi:CBS domain-containing protein|uniref:CBS domain-containing protein n=1 Tax=Eudoraea sp. TaxID=1979955 RepID=UPI00262A6F78|nr:CBS domain-containing protein [uncultured Eudoraea sp.]